MRFAPLDDEPQWITLTTLHVLHRRQVERFGGLDGVRDEGVLESTLARPRQQFHYAGPVTLIELAATYLTGLTQQQGYLDGNKRTALATTLTFLAGADVRIHAPHPELFALVIAAARTEVTPEHVAHWLSTHTQPW